MIVADDCSAAAAFWAWCQLLHWNALAFPNPDTIQNKLFYTGMLAYWILSTVLNPRHRAQNTSTSAADHPLGLAFRWFAHPPIHSCLTNRKQHFHKRPDFNLNHAWQIYSIQNFGRYMLLRTCMRSELELFMHASEALGRRQTAYMTT